MISNLKEVQGVEIPDGDLAAVDARIETVKAHLAALTKPTIKRFDAAMGMCVLCEHPVNESSGLISGPLTEVINTSRIFTKAGLRVWVRTGVCEKCVNETILKGAEHE